uniref:Endoplasmic reticulum lectin n=1 Tax=Anolis carolinensis TaxID=28377 RepID=H9GCH2_ANOCA
MPIFSSFSFKFSPTVPLLLFCQSKSADVVTISSKYKQKYECRLPAAAVKIHQDKEEDPQSYTGLGISELLKPMEAAPCLIKTKDWWTYEFCYGKHIQQYHMEESEIKGDILYLGYYQSAFDWDNETAKASKQHKLKRYHSQTYVNGSKCNLNGKPREAEVRFLCEEGAGDYIARVDEPQSCSYVLTVHTTRICHHPFLRPPSTATPQTIRCHPALSPAEYVEYVKAQVCEYLSVILSSRLHLTFQFLSCHFFLQNKEKTSESEASAQDTSPKKEPKGEREKPNEGAQEEEEEDEEELLGKFEKELEDILLQKSEMAELKEEVKSEMEKEFDHIINEPLRADPASLCFNFPPANANSLIRPCPLSVSDGNADGRVKVRVTKVKPGSARQKELRVQEMSRDNPQLRHIESVVKDLLEKEGLKAEGKIEIKIVTTGGLGDDDDTHWLSEEDTKNLKDIFFNILIQGTEEAHKEQRRQRQLEDNYRFVWRRNQEDLPTTGGTDSDELDF